MTNKSFLILLSSFHLCSNKESPNLRHDAFSLGFLFPVSQGSKVPVNELISIIDHQ